MGDKYLIKNVIGKLKASRKKSEFNNGHTYLEWANASAVFHDKGHMPLMPLRCTLQCTCL